MRGLFSVLSICVSAHVIAGEANANDLPVETPSPAAAAYYWTACYVGGYFGAAWQSRDVNFWDPQSTGGTIPAGTFYQPTKQRAGNDDDTNGNFNFNMGGSPAVGGTFGCNWQLSSLLMVGIEGDGGYTRVHAASIDLYSYAHGADTIAYTRIGNWEADITGRAGLILWDRLLAYVKVGVGFSKITSTLTDSCTAAPCGASTLAATGKSSQPFGVAGAGIEYAFTKRWSFKVETLFLGMYKNISVCGPGGGTSVGSTFCGRTNVEGAHTAKLGLTIISTVRINSGRLLSLKSRQPSSP